MIISMRCEEKTSLAFTYFAPPLGIIIKVLFSSLKIKSEISTSADIIKSVKPLRRSSTPIFFSSEARRKSASIRMTLSPDIESMRANVSASVDFPSCGIDEVICTLLTLSSGSDRISEVFKELSASP